MEAERLSCPTGLDAQAECVRRVANVTEGLSPGGVYAALVSNAASESLRGSGRWRKQARSGVRRVRHTSDYQQQHWMCCCLKEHRA